MITVFLLSFSVALSGAMAPGPLLTYTILQTMRQKRRGYLVGFWVIVGHAILEGLLIILLLSGFAFFFTDPLFSRIVAPLGGLFLVYLGLSLLVDVLRKGALPALPAVSAGAEQPSALSNLKNQSFEQSSPHSRLSRFNRPILAGIFVSMSNPYWWAWWAVAGLGLMLEQKISFRQWPQLIAFFLGHEAGDFFWYVFVSVLVYKGRHWLTDRLYRVVLLACSFVMIGFGLYLGIKPFVS